MYLYDGIVRRFISFVDGDDIQTVLLPSILRYGYAD